MADPTSIKDAVSSLKFILVHQSHKQSTERDEARFHQFSQKMNMYVKNSIFKPKQ